MEDMQLAVKIFIITGDNISKSIYIKISDLTQIKLIDLMLERDILSHSQY